MPSKHPPGHHTRELGPGSFRASFVPSSVDLVARTVELVWSTAGTRVKRGYYDPFLEELSLHPDHVNMERLRAGAPLLAAHDAYSLDGVLGVVESAKLEGDIATAIVRFAKAEDDPESDKIFRKVIDGILTNVSVGYEVHRLELVESSPDGDDLPVYRAIDWTPYELSIVPMGADVGAHVRSTGARNAVTTFIDPLQGDVTMAVKKKTDPEGGTAPIAATEVRTVVPVPTPAPVEVVDVAAAEEAARTGERQRSAEIRRVGKALDIDAGFIREHADGKTSAAEFMRLAVDKRAAAQKIPGGGSGHVEEVAGRSANEKWLRGASEWLWVRSGVSDDIVKAAKLDGETLKLDPGEFRGLSFLDLAKESLTRSGVNVRGMDRRTVIGMALTQMSQRDGNQGRGDFPILLENVMHKTLQATYRLASDLWTHFCAVGSVSDFRPHHRYRTGELGNLEIVNENGEITNLSIPDGERESISADTRGKIIALTRQALINDDMGAISRMATGLGRSAARSIENAVFALILENAGMGPLMADGKTLFHADHGNIGVDSVLGVDGLDADGELMEGQKDPAGQDYLALEPDVLLVPRGLKSKANILNKAEFDPDATSKYRKPNAVAGLYNNVVATKRLSGVRRYSFADRGEAPVIEVVFLDGNRAPMLENRQGFRVDGAEWKIVLDFGVGAIDYRGATTNKGSV